MKLSRRTLPLAVLAALAAPAAHAEVPIDVIGGSEVSFEGLLQADANWFHSDIRNLNGDAQDGDKQDAELRRAELVLKGKGPGNIEWVIGYDAKADKWLDTNLKYKLGGNANHYLQFGQFKQPNSLEELSSTKNNDFISKAMVTNTWAVARRVGAAYSVGDAGWSLTGSLFTRELKRGLAAGEGYGLRGTWAPINDTGSILHLGLSYVNYDAEKPVINGANVKNRAGFSVRPDADLAGARLIDTGNIDNADRIATTGLEAFWVGGPVKLQGEYMSTKVSRTTSAPSFKGTGGYISAVWNLTGETWGYKAGVPTTPLPNEPESGMWQLGLRYDTMDLNDGAATVVGNTATIAGVLGGESSTWSLGANWYLRSNFKLALNYVKVDSSKFLGKTSATYSRNPAYNGVTFNRVVDDNPDIIEFRAQFYW